MNGLTSTEHRALKAIAVQFFVNGAVVASYVPRLPGIRDRLGVDLSTVGLIIAVATGFGVVGSAIQVPVVERIGTRSTMIFGALGLVVLLPLVAFSPTWWSLLLVLGALSIGDVVVDVSMNVQGSVLSARRNTPVMNRLHGMWSLGTVVGAIVASVMAALDVDLRVHLIGAAIVLAAALAYVAPGLLDEDGPIAASESPTRANTRSVVAAFAVLGGAAILPEMINSDWAAFRLADDLGASAGLAAVAYVAFTAGMVTGRFLGDSAVTRFGSTTVLRRATVLAAVGTLIATTIPATAAVFVGLFVAGLGVSVMFPQLYDSAAQSAQSTSALGGLTAGSRIMLLVAPLAVGWMADTEALTVGAAIAIVTIPGALLVWVLSARLLHAKTESVV